jgi:hypothetical protein
MIMTQDQQSFQTLCEAALHQFLPAQWTDYYPVMAAWLTHDDATIRSRAVERLAMSVFAAEPSYVRGQETSDTALLNRCAWLIDTIEQAHRLHADTIPAFLACLRYHGHSDPFRSALSSWLDGLLHTPRIGVDVGMVEGTLLLLERIDTPWLQRAPRWLSKLDHVSDYVRACAAYQLGATCDDGEDTDPTYGELLDLIGRKEIERSGIAGPFWSSRYLGWTDDETMTLWLLDLLERRTGAAPNKMPFNDIDFYLHEMCSRSPDLVRRMIHGGHLDLALMTATEEQAPVAGMEPVLRELAMSHETTIATAAKLHLARLYADPIVPSSP